jgi:hypothetical protein
MTDPVDKFLSDAVSAARDHADDGVNDGAATRLRLRESLASSGASRRKRFTLIAAVIASLFGSTAFAYWAGWRPPWSKPAVVSESHDDDAANTVSMRLPEKSRTSIAAIPDAGVETTTTIEKPQALPSIDAGLGVAAEVGPTPAPPPAPVETKPAVVATKPVTRTVSRPRITKPSIVESTPVEPTPAPIEPVETKPPPPAEITKQAPPIEQAKPSAELAAYRNAHQLHFKGSDPKAALAAWNGYLAKYPNGTLALEARYDRALVLVKLARWAEARTALAPFANAKPGAYRQKEAAEILAAIKDR